MLEPRDDYSQEQYEEIADLVGKWSSFDLDKTDAYIYFDDLEKELVPSVLTPADRKRFIDYLKKEIEVVNGWSDGRSDSSSVAEVSDRIEEVSANSREVLVTMDEFTQHVSNLRDIPSHLKSETDKLKVEE